MEGKGNKKRKAILPLHEIIKKEVEKIPSEEEPKNDSPGENAKKSHP